MRERYTFINGFWAVLSYISIFVLGLICRRSFVVKIGSQILGFEGVFSNIFSLLSISEMGIGTIIAYRLYEQIAIDCKSEISRLLMIYKWLYRLIGLGVFIIGIILIPLLPYIINDAENITDLYSIYFMQLLSLVLSYFFSYRRLLFSSYQKNYICVWIDTVINLIVYFLRIVIITYTKSYILYFIVAIIGSLIANILLILISFRMYPFTKNHRINWEDIKSSRVLYEIKLFVLHRIANVVYGGTDNIIIARCLGISWVFLLTNYTAIEGKITNLLDKALAGIQAGIGNMIYSDDEDKRLHIFLTLNDLGFFLAAFVSVSYFVLFQPFIQLWLGKEFQLSNYFVYFFSMNQYVAWNHRMVSYYRMSIGNYDADLCYSVIATLMNIVLSIIFAFTIGIEGVLFATLISHVLLWIGRWRLVNKVILPAYSSTMYFLDQIFRFILLSSELYITYLISSYFAVNLIGLLCRMALCFVIPNVINLLALKNGNGFKYISNLVTRLINKFNL